MGDGKKRRDAFSAWYLALPPGRKIAISLGLVLSTILPAGLMVSVVDTMLQESDVVTVHCGERKTTISREDPIWDETDPVRAQNMCDRAWGRS